MRELRSGIVGLGSMGRNHVRVLSSLEGFQLVGVFDRGYLDEQLPVKMLPSLEDLLSLELDYCVVAVPTAEHLSVGLALAEARVPTLIEKPIAVDRPSAERLIDAFAVAGVIAGVGHIERFNPAAQEARRRIDSGQLGELIQIATVRQGPFPGRFQDVGVGLDLATHDIDLASWIAQSHYRSVMAHARQLPGHPHEDLLAIVGSLSSQVVTSHVINWLSPRKERQVTIIGERGLLQIDTLSSDLTFFENGSVPNEWGQVAQFRGISQGDVTRYAFPKREPLVLEHEAMRDAILGEPAEIVSLEDAARTLHVALSALASAELGSVVAVGS